MKKIIAIFCLGFVLVAIFVVAMVCKPKANANNVNQEYLRIHIRANSNSKEDQAVKFLVKERVVEFLTPIVASAKTQTQAKELVKNNLDHIQEIANSVLAEQGFFYSSAAKFVVEDFPTRTYESTTLECGSYEALVLELGQGTGDNWWCVVFPPLCFVAGNNDTDGTIKYHSKILELIQKYIN